MDIRYAARSLAVVVFAALSAGSIVAAPDAHDHGHGAQPAKALPAGQRWPTDDALRQGMERIRASLEPKLESVHAGKATQEDYRAIASSVESQVAYIVANCKLPPDADAALHVSITQMLEGADAMSGRSKAKPRAGAVKVAAALDRYGREFDHPGWQPLHR